MGFSLRKILGRKLTWDELDGNFEALGSPEPGKGTSLLSFLNTLFGAVSRNLTAKLCDWVSVKDFGAVGDGVTDDTAAFQAAVSAASAIFVPSGTYKITSPITVPSNRQIRCSNSTYFTSQAGAGKIFYVAGSWGTAYPLTVNAASGATSVTLSTGDAANFSAGDWVQIYSNGLYDNASYGDAKMGEIVQVESSASGLISLKSPLASGAYLTADTAMLRKCTFVQNVQIIGGQFVGDSNPAVFITAIYVLLGYRCRISGSRAQYCNGNAFNIRDSLFCSVENVHVKDSLSPGTGYGVNFTDSCQDCTVVDSTFTRCRHAVTNTSSDKGVCRRITYQNLKSYNTINTGDAFDTHSNADDILFLNCISYDSSSAGFNIECASAKLSDCIALNSSIDGFSFTCGAVAKKLNDYSASNCQSINAGVYGFRFGPATSISATKTKKIMLDGCSSENSSNSGIYLHGNASLLLENVEVIGGYFEGNDSNAGGAYIGDYVKKFRIIGGHYVATSGISNAIQVNGSAVSYGVISDNVLEFSASGATGACLYLRKADSIVVSGNVGIQPSSAGYGIRLFESPTNINVAKDNGMDSCAVPGVSYAVGVSLVSDTLTMAHGGDMLVQIDTEAAAATDNLITISGGSNGQVVTLTQASSARDITVVDNTGNLRLAGNFTMDNVQDTLTLIKYGSNWVEVSRSDIA